MRLFRFDRQFHTYNNHAVVQKKVAEKLLNFIDKNSVYNSVLELGCGTGIFTNVYYNKLKFNSLDLNDIFDSRDYFSHIEYRDFFIENMENLSLKNYSLILSSSAFQWLDRLDDFLKKLSFSTNNLIFSIYVKGNLIEINNHFKISLDYLSTNEIYIILKKYFSNIQYEEESFKIFFETPLLLLKHLKYTGVTGFSKANYSEIKSFKERELTYRVAYFKCRK